MTGKVIQEGESTFPWPVIRGCRIKENYFSVRQPLRLKGKMDPAGASQPSSRRLGTGKGFRKKGISQISLVGHNSIFNVAAVPNQSTIFITKSQGGNRPQISNDQRSIDLRAEMTL